MCLRTKVGGDAVAKSCMADRSNRSYGNYENYENYENVAIKREQRLLADYAEHEQRKECEAGLIMGD